jgi:hypothetical protein
MSLPLGPVFLPRVSRDFRARARETPQRAKIGAATANLRLQREHELGQENRAHRVDKRAIAEANLLLHLSKAPKQGRQPSAPRDATGKACKLRCGKCESCLRGDCGKCGNCLDKRKFGGPGARKQACSASRCLFAKPNYREARALEP